jgi:hypothetical protein
MLLRRLLTMVLLATSACGPANGLEGSIGETRPLDFDFVEIKKQDAFLLVEYVRSSTSATEKVCKLVVDTEGLDLPKGGSFDLTGDRFLEHVELQRATVANDLFPPKKSGDLEFHDIDFRGGGKADGEFRITFENEGSLSGWFSGIIDVST